MDLNQMGSIGSVGSFVIAGIIFIVQIWPYPQLKAKYGKGATSANSPPIRLKTTAIGVLLALGFLLAGVATYGAWHPAQPQPAVCTALPNTVATENVESSLHQWIGHYGLAYTNVEGDPTTIFGLVIQLQGGNSVIVARPKAPWDNYLLVAGNFSPSPSELSVLQKMPKEQVQRLKDTLSIEMARTHVAYRPLPMFAAHFETRIPIDSTLTEYSFGAAMDELDDVQTIMVNTMAINTGQY